MINIMGFWYNTLCFWWKAVVDDTSHILHWPQLDMEDTFKSETDDQLEALDTINTERT